MAVNAHTHLYSGLTPFGMPVPNPKPQDFPQILRQVWWKLDRALDHQVLRAAARFYVASALLHGTTTLVDHHESPSCIEGSLDVIAEACAELGIRAVLCYGATERNGGLDEARRGLRECQRLLSSNKRPLVRGVVGLHASFTLTDMALREAADLCKEMKAIVHVHVAEHPIDVQDARMRGYAGPLQRLLALGALPPGSIVAHGVHLSPADVQIANSHDLWLIQCPRSNEHNGVGYPRALSFGDRVALGTDGFPSNMGAETLALYKNAVEASDDFAKVSRRAQAGDLLAATFFGSEVLSDTVISLLDTNGRRVDTVVVAGSKVVSGGRLVRGDMQEIVAEAENAARPLWQRMAGAMKEEERL